MPTDVAFSPAGNWAYVTNQFAQSVSVIDTRMSRQVITIAVEGDPFRVAVGPEGQRVYVTTNQGTVIQIDAETRRVNWVVSLGGNLNGLAINFTDERIYVGDVDGAIYELSPGGEVIRKMAIPGRPQGLALLSDGKEIYVAGEAGEFIALDLQTGSEKARVPLGASSFGIAVTPDQSQIWITAPAAGQVFVLDRASLTISRTIRLGGMPRRIAFDAHGTTAVIANEANAISMVR
ncbi:MAG: YncE family protein [Gemmatimonadales bacterium]